MEKVIRQLEENNVEAESDADTINKIWKAIEEAILEAANKQILKKKVFNTKITRRQNQRKQQYRHIIELQRIVKKAKTKENQEAEENEREETNNKLRAIGAEMGVCTDGIAACRSRETGHRGPRPDGSQGSGRALHPVGPGSTRPLPSADTGAEDTRQNHHACSHSSGQSASTTHEGNPGRDDCGR